jgi:hypothetical protein
MICWFGRATDIFIDKSWNSLWRIYKVFLYIIRRLRFYLSNLIMLNDLFDTEATFLRNNSRLRKKRWEYTRDSSYKKVGCALRSFFSLCLFQFLYLIQIFDSFKSVQLLVCSQSWILANCWLFLTFMSFWSHWRKPCDYLSRDFRAKISDPKLECTRSLLIRWWALFALHYILDFSIGDLAIFWRRSVAWCCLNLLFR